MKYIRILILVIVLGTIAYTIYYVESGKVDNSPTGQPQEEIVLSTIQEKENRYPKAQEVSTPDAFINTEPLTIAENIGKKVILVDFWTYSCINCQRTLPHLKAWHEKYADDGLLILGVHTPEFEFEKELANVQKAVDNFSVPYPVILDNDYSTWRAYKNRYWPRKYIIDIDGYIVYDHIGEGAYEETEKKIRELLKEKDAKLNLQSTLDDEMTNVVAETATREGRLSPEIYFGASRNNLLFNGKPGTLGIQNLKEQEEILSNALYLAGDWDIQKEYAGSTEGTSKIIFRYRADKVFMVASSEEAQNITIMHDGEIVEDAAGEDVVDGKVEIKDEQLYKLIDNEDGYGEHTLEIIIDNPGFRAYTFTFG